MFDMGQNKLTMDEMVSLAVLIHMKILESNREPKFLVRCIDEAGQPLQPSIPRLVFIYPYYWIELEIYDLE